MPSPGQDHAAASPRSSFVLLDSNGQYSPGTHSDGGTLRTRPEPYRTPHSLHSLRRLYPPTPTAHSDDDGTRSEGGGHRANLRRRESISDLFPMPGASVFTTPANIMPTREASILIDTDVQQAAAQDPGHRLGVQPAGSSILQSVLEQKGEGRGSRLTSSTNASARNEVLEGESLGHNTPSENTRSRSSFLDGIPPMEPVKRGARWALRLRRCCKWQNRQIHRWRLRHRIVSLWRRLMPNWDSFELNVTLSMAVIGVALAVAIAKVLSDATPDQLHMVARCALPGGMASYTASTAYLAGVIIPTVNNVVFFIVALWMGLLCSRSRKRVLRSAPCSISSNLKSAFMLPCYEAIWYTIAALSAAGLVLYFVSFQAYKSDNDKTYKPLTLEDDPNYPCSVVTMPSVWVLQLLPMLMIQRSVSQEAVLRAISYSGAVCVVLVICYMTLYKVGHDLADAIAMVIYILLLLFYFWAKFVFHARATFDFFFVTAVVTSFANILSSVMGIAHVDAATTLPIVHCIATGLDSLTVVAVMLSLRADTRYWLAIDDSGTGTSASSSAMRRYVNLLSERGMITNFSTRTSVYDVHHMIEEHRHNVVDFSALALDCIIAQGATSIVMRGTLRRNTRVPIALKIYTDVQVTNEEVQRFSRETALNVQLSHPNVVRFFGLCVVPPSISLIFEFCEYGALDATLRENPEIWTLAAKLKAWLDACRAVAYLHSFSPPLLHRDIKTDNFLVGQDFLIKLADFGEANLLRPRSDGTMTIAGTVDYMAPEMIKGGKTARYGTAVDVYSLMITLWQIMVPSRSPWEAKSHLEVYRAVENGERPPLLPTIPKGCAEILEAGWAANPSDRVAVEDIIPSVHRLWLLAMHQKPLKRTEC
ncbi:Protein tyrosine kinase [Phytophthora infestans]|uniref:Protein tyrosine kinase n=1 Tax=Phytophthora infestans TaxID=4787 RepID=A0A833T0I3_PHYIN|nr:Protein tyrosine kinase [Phytophthora infestans]